MNLATEFRPVPKPTKSAKEKKSSLKRSPMKKRRSARAKARDFSPEVEAIVFERSGGICEFCHQRRIAHLHHTVFRRHVKVGTLDIALGVCLECHDIIHGPRKHRERAVKLAKELARG